MRLSADLFADEEPDVRVIAQLACVDRLSFQPLPGSLTVAICDCVTVKQVEEVVLCECQCVSRRFQFPFYPLLDASCWRNSS